MRNRLFFLLVSLVAASVVTASALAHDSGSAGPCSSGNVTKTASYVLSLGIGSPEEMYLPSEVKARHLKTGEVMLGGEMAMIGHVPAGTKAYHLEVHICNRAGAVVTKLKPTIDVDDALVSMKMTHISVAIMQGVGEGIEDYHYGNEVTLTPGHRITVTVVVKGERAVFHATVPKRS